MEKGTWYRNRDQGTGPKEGRRDPRLGFTRPGKRKQARTKHSPTNKFQPVAPLFVPRAQNGGLISKLREVQLKLSDLGKESMPKIELVEEGLVMLKSFLVQTDPWKDTPCTDTQKTACAQGEGAKPGQCNVMSVVYRNR